MKAKMKTALLLAVTMVMMVFFTACTAVQISGELVLNADGTGHRSITGRIAKQDYQDGYGSAYYYFKQHGVELEAALTEIYNAQAEGSEEWLTVSVDDSGSEWEIVTLSFEFSSFEDYTTKLAALAFDETVSFTAPEWTTQDDMTIYSESIDVMTAIFKSIQNAVMADDTLYDPACTKDGVPLNDGSADGQLGDYGVELVKPENGDGMVIQLNGGAAAAVNSVDGFFTVSAGVGGEQIEKEHETTCVLNYSFDDTLSNQGTAADNDLSYGIGSTEGGPVYEEGVLGNAIRLDGNTYLTTPNKSYSYSEMTVSFYYRMDAYTQTDTGANMLLVPAGLGALGAGVIDFEFIQESEDSGVQLLGKMNSSDWQTQDKLYSEGYILNNRLNEWHNYTFVFQNQYDADGMVEDAFVYMYIDGKLAARSRLSVAAGLTFSLGMFDDGANGEPNGGFNVGGYYENGTVKRTCTGALDNLLVFDGALSEEEIQTLCYTEKVAKEYDPEVIDTLTPDTDKEEETTPEPVEPTKAPAAAEEEKDSPAVLIIIVAAVVAILGAAVLISVKKRKK